MADVERRGCRDNADGTQRRDAISAAPPTCAPPETMTGQWGTNRGERAGGGEKREAGISESTQGKDVHTKICHRETCWDNFCSSLSKKWLRSCLQIVALVLALAVILYLLAVGHGVISLVWSSPGARRDHPWLCWMCKRAVSAAEHMARSNPHRTQWLTKSGCKWLHIEQPDVCEGIVQEYGTMFLAMVANRLIPAVEVCSALRYCPESGNRPSPCNSVAFWEKRSLFLQNNSYHIAPNEKWSERMHTKGAEDSRELHHDWLMEAAQFMGEDIDGRTRSTSVDMNSEELEKESWQLILPETSDGRDEIGGRGGVGSSSKRILNEQAYRAADVDIGHFLQISDIHLDTHYSIGAEVMCGKPLCCQEENGPGKTASRRAKRFGDYHCDSPMALLDALLKYVTIPGNLPPLDFIVFTGDTPPHSVWKDSRESTEEVMKVAYGMLASAFKNSTPLYPVLGNHASVPTDVFPLPPSNKWLMDLTWELWKEWLPAECESSVRKAGYYTLLHNPSLRIVGLNTQYCDILNFWLLSHTKEPDPADQFAWLFDVLQSAEEQGEAVIILGHIPAGDESCFSSYAERYAMIVERFQHTIVAQIFGHTHRDEFKVLHSMLNHSVPTSLSLVAPSVTPFSNRNPSFRVYDYHRKPFVSGGRRIVLEDYTQYMLDLDFANMVGRASNWVAEYKVRSLYKLDALTPESFHDLATRMAKDSDLLAQYMNYWMLQRPAACDKVCLNARLCYQVTNTFEGYKHCMGGKVDGWGMILATLMNKIMEC